MELNNEFRGECQQAREKWWPDQCQDLELLDSKRQADLMYNQIQKLTGNDRVTNRSPQIKDQKGNFYAI